MEREDKDHSLISYAAERPKNSLPFRVTSRCSASWSELVGLTDLVVVCFPWKGREFSRRMPPQDLG